MKQVVRFRTQDGVLHETVRAASKHAEQTYGDAISRMSHRMLKETNFKYGKIAEFFDANLDEFLQLRALKMDCQLESPEDEDD